MIRGFLAIGAILWLLTPAITVNHPLFIGLQATAWLAVIILVLVALPGWRTRVIAVFTVLVLIEMPLLRVPPDSPDDAVRVVAINTQYGQSDRPELLTDIAQLEPDLVVLAETSDAEATAVAQATGLVHSGPPIKRDGKGVAILTADGATVRPQLTPGLHQLPVVEKHGVTVVGVHTVAPANARQLELWRHDFTELSQAVADNEALIMAGDYNAATTHPPMKALGLEDCAPLTPTWPSLAAVIRIDHILVKNASCGASGAFRVAGTDHVGIWADVLPQPAGA